MLPTLLVAESIAPQPATARPTASSTASPPRGPDDPAVTRTAETETLLRTFTYPSFRAAGLHLTLVRSTHLRDAALNSFADTGNPVFAAPAARRPTATNRKECGCRG
jgi:hypothetical protein